MNAQVLITYASKYGATAAIAEAIGETLKKDGLSVDVVPVDQVQDISSYEAVILGSAVYMGSWRKKAARFLKDHESELARKEVWLFSSGPTGEGDPKELLKGWTLPPKLKALADRIQVQDIAVFGGALDTDKLNSFDKWIIKRVKGPVGDFRNWEAIKRWAEEIGSALKMGVPV
jgi:menaquinone-dependent protoporphyrinogen oxidase